MQLYDTYMPDKSKVVVLLVKAYTPLSTYSLQYHYTKTKDIGFCQEKTIIGIFWCNVATVNIININLMPSSYAAMSYTNNCGICIHSNFKILPCMHKVSLKFQSYPFIKKNHKNFLTQCN